MEGRDAAMSSAVFAAKLSPAVPERWGKENTPGELTCRFALEISEDKLVFSVAAPCSAAEKAVYPAPGFMAGLWRRDCTEFFLGNAENGRYVEFNLSPGGAWWSCGFSAPRVAAIEEDWQIKEVSTETKQEDGQWRGQLKVPFQPVADMLKSPAWREWTGNVTFVVGSGNAQRYFSVAELAGERPDFHQPLLWPSLMQLL